MAKNIFSSNDSKDMYSQIEKMREQLQQKEEKRVQMLRKEEQLLAQEFEKAYQCLKKAEDNYSQFYKTKIVYHEADNCPVCKNNVCFILMERDNARKKLKQLEDTYSEMQKNDQKSRYSFKNEIMLLQRKENEIFIQQIHSKYDDDE